MKTTYILRSERLDGEIKVVYFNRVFNALEMEFKEPLTESHFLHLKNSLPFREEDISELSRLGLSIVVEKTNEKIALFCNYYMRYKKGLKYRVSPADSGKIKLIRVDDSILEAYFTSGLFEIKGPTGSPGKHSIANLVKYYNELLAEVATKNTSKYPDYWEKSFEDKLQNQEKYKYWSHLRSLGLSPKKDRLGNVTEWIANKNVDNETG